MKHTYNFTTFDTRAALQTAAAMWIETCLRDAISRRNSAVFMASGGRTPEPVYTRLSAANIDWSSVVIGLTDERWVGDDHPASNTAMVRAALLRGKAGAAEFMPMKTTHRDAFDAVAAVNDGYTDALLADVMLLGMGADAHTLSWFAGARGFAQAVDPDSMQAVAAIEAVESDVTGPDTLRMTLTQPCVANARAVLLLLTGAEKRAVFEQADAGSPAGIMVRAAGHALTVYYAD